MEEFALEAQIALFENVYKPFERPNAFLLYGMPKVGKSHWIEQCFPEKKFDIYQVEVGNYDFDPGLDPNDEKPRVIVYRHMEELLRADSPFGIQDVLVVAIKALKKEKNTTVIATLSGKVPTSLHRDLLVLFNYQIHVPLPTPDDRKGNAECLLQDFYEMQTHKIEFQFTDEDWELFKEASRYADYGVIRTFLIDMIGRLNREWIRNGGKDTRIVDGQLLRASLHRVDNQPCIVGYDLEKRSMHVRQYAKTKVEEERLASKVEDPTAKRPPLKKRKK